MILPILHDADSTPNDIFESESFQEILTTLRALAANDDRIIEYFRAVSQGQQHTGGGSVEFDIDERLAQRIDLAQFVNEIELRCWDRLAKLSWRSFEEARKFVRNLGLKTGDEWREFCKGNLPEKGTLPKDIPATPVEVYADKGWAGIGDWLGTGNIASHQREFCSFKNAREFARSLGFDGHSEWREFCKGNIPEKGTLPVDMPSAPNRTYADDGWMGWGDWLGTGNIAYQLREYRSFKEARAFARGLGLKSQTKWKEYSKGNLPEKGTLPKDIPSEPQGSYAAKGWKGWGDWLGTGNIAPHQREFCTFENARKFARSLGLKSRTEWSEFCKGNLRQKGTLPTDIPSSPSRTYADDGWMGWGDWLGTGNIANQLREYRSFKEARAYAHSLRLESGEQWSEFCKGNLPEKGTLPTDIPANPNQTCKDKGWKGWGDWLGTGNIANQLRQYQLRQYRAFKKAREFAHSLGLKNQTEWREFCKGNLPEKGTLPKDIPATPVEVYADEGWVGIGDWLGTGNIAPHQREFCTFENARKFARSLGLKSRTEWSEFCKGNLRQKGTLPTDIPSSPSRTYADDGWMGWGDWLGTGNIAPRLREFRSFKEARAFARRLRLKTRDEWSEFYKGNLPEKGTLPKDIPAAPSRTYAAKGWKGWGDWLGYKART